jgi:hypothetical protein
MVARQLDALEQAARRGDAAAAAELGLRLLSGRGVVPSPQRGAALINQAAQAGDPRAAFAASTLSSTSLWRLRNWDESLDYLLQAATLGHTQAQRALQILAAGPNTSAVENGDWAVLRESINIDSWMQVPDAELLRESPRVQVFRQFLPATACDWLIEQARNGLSRATIYDKRTGGHTADGRRTNSQCDLGVENSGILTFVLRARIGAITGRPELAMEIPKVLHYQPGETFAEHYDYLTPDEPAFAQELAMRGQRAQTFLVYLNDGFEGGETAFPELGLTFKGEKGDALLFSNLDESGAIDPRTRHAGLPPTSGEKWLFSQWIRDLPAA